MPTPASGAIGMTHVNAEIGAAATATRDMAWIRANTKDGQNNFANIRSRAWYAKNNGGANDSRAWLQVNCNCNCDCNCSTCGC